MLVKAVFLTFLILFSLLSFFIDLPPGTLVTDTMNLSFPYSTLLTTNLLNGIFFGSIIGLAIFLARKNTKPKIPKYSPPTTSSLDYEIENLLSKDQKSETVSNLTEIKGIGTKRAEELELAGVKTISDLAKRSPKHLAEKTDIPITQISKWIIEANKLTK
jgi:predicted flap endonuclease-1-like 5' DNA nuclease